MYNCVLKELKQQKSQWCVVIIIIIPAFIHKIYGQPYTMPRQQIVVGGQEEAQMGRSALVGTGHLH